MSLINQALRKAQRDRAPNRMSGNGSEAGIHTGYGTPEKRGPGLVVALVIGIAVLIGLVAGLTVVLLQKEPSPAPSQNEIAATVANAQSAPPATPATSPTTPIQAAPIATPAPEPIAPAPVPVVTTETPETETASSSILAELGAARTEVEEKVEAAAIQAKTPSSPSVRTWLSSAQVAGVRISDRGNKAIINGKTYKSGDMIDYELELEVIQIEQNRITLKDAKGKEYKLSF